MTVRKQVSGTCKPKILKFNPLTIRLAWGNKMKKSNVTQTKNCKENGFLTYDTIEQARCNANKFRRLFKTLKFGIVEDGKVYRVISI